jgi:hypothetical protein
VWAKNIVSKTIHKPLSPGQKCHFIKAQTNNNIVKAVQQEQINQITSQLDHFAQGNNAIDNF